MKTALITLTIGFLVLVYTGVAALTQGVQGAPDGRNIPATLFGLAGFCVFMMVVVVVDYRGNKEREGVK